MKDNELVKFVIPANAGIQGQGNIMNRLDDEH